METPRQRFLGYRSLATMILIPHWPEPGIYLVLALVPAAPPPVGREEQNLVLNAGHPLVTMATEQLAQKPAHQSCFLLKHKGPQTKPLPLDMGMRSL